MKKKQSFYTLTAAVLALSMLLGGCGSSSSSSSVSSASDSYSYNGMNYEEAEPAEEAYGDYESDYDSSSDSSYQSSESSSSENIPSDASLDDGSSTDSEDSDYSQKLIYTYNFSFETLDYDASMAFINAKVEEYGGYMESYSVYGSTNRDASMTLRIPKEHIQEFLNETGSIGEMTRQSVSAEDVTLEYYDVADRLETLKAKHARLLALLDKAETLTDIAQLESEISDCEYEIDNYQTRLKIYDNQVDYVTIYIDLWEVEQIEAVESDSFLTRLQKGLAASTYDLVDSLIDLIVWLIVNLPYIIFAAIVILVVWRIVRKVRKKHGKRGFGKKADQASENYYPSGKRARKNGNSMENGNSVENGNSMENSNSTDKGSSPEDDRNN